MRKLLLAILLMLLLCGASIAAETEDRFSSSMFPSITAEKIMSNQKEILENQAKIKQVLYMLTRQTYIRDINPNSIKQLRDYLGAKEIEIRLRKELP
jgi:hypothetical protein